jgi:Flp pilus assembly protein TadG
MRLLGYPLRRRRSRGQALVEFALVIPIFLTILVSIGEFMFLSTAYISVDFASHDASEVAAIYGNTAGADCAVLQRIDNDIMAPANPTLIKTVTIFWVNTATANGSAMAGAENIYTYNGGNNPCTTPAGTTIYVPFPNVPTIEATTGGYPESTRCNVNQATGCLATNGVAHTQVDTIGVTITYQYNWMTPFPTLISGSGTGPLLTVTNMTRLEPVL